jgi:3-oxoacyl-[acyl-carrier-protein] synthase-1
MSAAPPLAVLSTGLVTSLGLSAEASCAALRAKISNPTETRFLDSGGTWIMAHEVQLERPWRGRSKLALMAAMAIEEALAEVPRREWVSIPLLLCVAEAERPGRTDGLDDRLFAEIGQQLGARFAPESAVVPLGRVAVAAALAQARALTARGGPSRVVVAAVDSLLGWHTLSCYEREDRLLTERNSNGFMPGDGAAALLVGVPPPGPALCVTGLGFASEPAHIGSDLPLRGDGLTQAVKAALAEAGCGLHALDFRVADVSGEQYYFKEAALALSRVLRERKEDMELWHAAEGIGETGAAAGGAAIAWIHAACRKGYAKGPGVLAHFANDGGRRAALCLQARGMP